MSLEHATESQPTRLEEKYSRNCFKTALQLSADLGCVSKIGHSSVPDSHG